METSYNTAFSEAGKVYMFSMSKEVTSAQINDATQTRFVPGEKPDLPDDRPSVYVILLIPFILLIIKICDLYYWIVSRKK